MSSREFLLLVLAGCGRIAFDPLGDPGDGGGSGTGDAGGPDAPFPFPNANRVFVSRTVTNGNLGGLAGGDQICQQDAINAGLSGTYVAFLSISTFNAIDRLQGSRGWVRADGAPVLDLYFDLPSARVLNVPDRDVTGAIARVNVWTGSNSAGLPSSFGTCSDWASTAGNAGTGSSGRGQPALLAGSMFPCTAPLSLLCFGLGANEVVTPIATSGRRMFIAPSRSGPGLAGLDGPCQAEAAAANLPGTYLAAVATTSSSIASRFTIDSRPWVRIDGTHIADGGMAVFDSEHASLVHQNAAGAYVNTTLFWTGATSPHVVGTPTTTCNDWASQVIGDSSIGGAGYAVDVAEFWNNTTFACSYGQPILCLQE
jgi:hypothetical protein